jgi:hypothetical protein
MEIAEIVAEVECAAECYSWGPQLLTRWLSVSKLPPQAVAALEELARGTNAPRSAGFQDDALSREVVSLVNEGATPNEIRRRLEAVCAQQAVWMSAQESHAA